MLQRVTVSLRKTLNAISYLEAKQSTVLGSSTRDMQTELLCIDVLVRQARSIINCSYEEDDNVTINFTKCFHYLAIIAKK